MTRFVMRNADAVDLLLEATAMQMSGSVLCRLMPAYLLGDLADTLSELHGGLTYHIAGLRPGERLHESLVSEAEALFTQRHGDFVRITPGHHQAGTVAFSSADAHRLTRSELRALIADSGPSTP